MTNEQILQWVLAIAGVIFGGGGIAAIAGVFVTRKLGVKTSENEANRDLNSTWDSIVENLQGQIDSQSNLFTAQLQALYGKISSLETRQGELEEKLGAKERLILKAIAHIIKLEALVAFFGGTPESVPKRPEGLE